jgi:antitoxin CcdA
MSRSTERRRAVNLTLPGDLVAAARALGVNTSEAAEAGIAAAVRQAREEAWLKANAAAVVEHRAWLDRHGMPLEPAWPGDGTLRHRSLPPSGWSYLLDNPADVPAVLPTCLAILLTPAAAIGTPTG